MGPDPEFVAAPDPDSMPVAVPNPTPALASAPRKGEGNAPFSWQHGSQLLLLEASHAGWIFAELHFDGMRCRYVEVRRAHYRWAREAAGALLSRALAAGDATADDLAKTLLSWLVARQDDSTLIVPPVA